ncbi:MAG: insulinase family protein [Caulobacter sp.]|nr:insulinase family protein [Caulobacter sp.]
MNRFLGVALSGAMALSMTSCAQLQEFRPDFSTDFALPTFRPAPPPVPVPPPGPWPQSVSDVKPDPTIRFGALPNGMRYAIVHNATPPGQASLRLHIRAGSLYETDAQQGLAHFLEHMAFNGSRSIPEGELIPILERHGLAFGADTNASTGFEETVYKLDLPQTDEDTVQASLLMLRETASELLIAQEAVERERGIVLSEERTRDGPGWRLYKSSLAFIMKGQRPPERFPIGKVEVLKSADRDQILDFYQRYYRPERATLIAAGDFDVEEMEARIKARFGDWTGKGEPGSEPAPGPVAKRQIEARVAVEPGSPTGLQITWVAPPAKKPDSLANRSRDLQEQLGFAILNRRLSVLARSEEPPFISAGAFKGEQLHAAGVTALSITSRPDDWRRALAAAEQEQRRLVQHGVLQAELDREIEEYRSFFRSRAAGAATRRTPQLAGEILSSLDDDEVVTSPAEDLAEFESSVMNLKAEAVSSLVRSAFRGEGPLLFLSTPSAIPGGESAVVAAYQASRDLPVAPPEQVQKTAWPYTRFGETGEVVEQQDILDLEATMVRFANGVRLTVRPTKYRDDQILVRVRIGNGLLDFPADRQSAGWAASSLVEGGLGQLTANDIERVLASRAYGANLAIEDDALVLSGATRPDDLGVQLQVLAAYATDPGWRPEAFRRMKGYAAPLEEQYRATTGGVLSRELPGLLHDGDRRWTWPSTGEIAATRLEDLQAILAPALANGQIEIIIVGDTTAEKAIELAAETFGSLPSRPAAGSGDRPAAKVGFPAPRRDPVVLRHRGRKDQAIAMLAWRTDDLFSDLQRARNTTLLAQILELRLTDELREKQGATYSPSVNSSHSSIWDDWGLISASVEIPPELTDGFVRDTLKIAADLREKPPGDDELLRAKRPYVESLIKAQASNEYWLSQLAGAQTDPRRLDAARSVLAGIERVSPQDIQDAAQRFLQEDKAWRLLVLPEGQQP